MNKVKVIKPWSHYRIGSIHKFTDAETRVLKALGNVIDYVEHEAVKETDSEAVKETKKRTYKHKDIKPED